MTDYIDDLRSLVGNPKVIMEVAVAFVFNEQHQLLLHRRTDNGYWGLPGGFMELDEKRRLKILHEEKSSRKRDYVLARSSCSASIHLLKKFSK